ncbi:MAG: glucose 1-dehydrogenase [Pseudomonadota bacterium]
MSRLQDKVAIITGGAGGIGRAAAKLFAAEGAKVVLVDLDEAAVAQAAAQTGHGAIGISADVSNADATQSYVKAAMDAHGRLDVLFSNAGIEGGIEMLSEYPVEEFDRVMSINVRGVWLSMKYAIPEMIKSGGGSVVCTSSMAGLKAMPKLSAYIASKHAVVGLVKSAALEYAAAGIRVNSINPAPIATRMIEALEEGYAPGAADKMKERFARSVPLKRYGDPIEVAKLALFLASEESSYCTGATFPVDGGMSAQ